MTQNELSLLQQQLSTSRRYLEFGAGESTKMAVATHSIESIDSVESSRAFLDDRLLSLDEIQQAVKAARLRFHYIDLGPTGDWGVPRDRNKRHLWPSYSSSIFAEKPSWDLVLIDGRFRVACCLNTLLHTGPDCRILIHDFWPRPEYRPLLEFLDQVDRVDTFGYFRRKNQVDTDKMKALLERYQYYPFDKSFWQRVHRYLLRKVNLG